MSAESKRRWRQKYPERAQASTHQWKIANPGRDRHGIPTPQIRAAFWDAQDGHCYLCEQPLNPQAVAHVDHDWRCCPKDKSCRYCRRGIACHGCNTLIGAAGDSPERLRLIADNLAHAQAAAAIRIANKPVQEPLDDVAIHA